MSDHKEVQHIDPMTVVVTPLALGEEGKGNTVEFFSSFLHSHTNWRHGGHQGAHNVTTSDGKEHMFRHFGAGTFAGADTYLQHMVINPIELFAEARELEELGVIDALSRIAIHEDCLSTTLFHAAMSRLREIMRGDEKKGTIGKGVGEAIKDSHISDDISIRAGEFHDESIVTPKIKAIFEKKRDEARALAATSPLGKSEAALHQLETLENESLVEIVAQSCLYLADLVHIVDDTYTKMLLERDGVIVTEPSHGVLLDPWYGFAPHVSQVRPTSKDVLQTLEKHDYSGKIVRLGVSRCYLPRHGAGPLVSFSKELTDSIEETHNNADTEWLGEFRSGHYDVVALEYSIRVCGGPQAFDGLVMNFMDKMQGKSEWEICEAYTYQGEDAHDLETYFEIENSQIRGIKMHPNTQDEAHRQHQLRLTHLLKNCHPVLVALRPTATQSLEEVFYDYVKNKLHIPVVAVAYGPKAEDRFILPEYASLFAQEEAILPEFGKRNGAGNTRAEQIFDLISTQKAGVEGPIHTVDVSLSRGNRIRHVETMIIKGLIPRDRGEERDALSSQEKWYWLKMNGFPVVNTFRVNQDEDAILMTDVTKNGRLKIVDKHNTDYEDGLIVIQNVEALQAEIREIATRAYDEGNGVYLSWESYCVLVDEKGYGQVTLLDLGALSYRLKNARTRMEKVYYSKEDAQFQAERFITTCLVRV